MSFLIRRGQSVHWRMSLEYNDIPADMTGGAWGIAETSFVIQPTFEQGATEAFVNWTPQQTSQMRPGRRKLRLKFTQANGVVKVFPDIWIIVE
ncbi:MAG: hypothetical protein V4696_01415 [Pseudomonadota bacterium]